MREMGNISSPPSRCLKSQLRSIKAARTLPVTLTPVIPGRNFRRQNRGDRTLLSAKDGRMKTFFTKLRDVAISGFLALFPI